MTERQGIIARVKAMVKVHPRATAGVLAAGLALFVFVIVWFQPHKLFFDVRVSEGLPQGADATAMDAGTPGAFIGIDHHAAGTAALLDVGGTRFVHFDEMFEVSNGPDLVVWLTAAAPDAAPNTFADDFIDLGPLEGNIGDQNYELVAGTDTARYRTVVVWCRRFKVAFAAAPIEA